MKVIECSVAERSERPAGSLDRLRQVLNQTSKDVQAQEAVINTFQKYLDGKYTILRNVPTGGGETAIPLVMVGPPGVWVINSQGVRGVFRAGDDNWEQLDDRRHHYQPARPNLLLDTTLMGSALQSYLVECEPELPPVEAVLFFADPGTHVDASRPSVRVVLADALERFLVGVMQRPPAIDQECAQRVVNLIAREQSQIGRAAFSEQDAFAFQEEAPPKPLEQVIVDTSEPEFVKKIPFSKRQWIFLGLMLIINVILLSAFVVLVLRS